MKQMVFFIAISTLLFFKVNRSSEIQNDSFGDFKENIQQGDVHEQSDLYVKDFDDSFSKSKLNSQKTVEIVDHGFGITRFTVQIPTDWVVDQYIKTDPKSFQFLDYKLDYHGPNGELIRSVCPSMNYHVNGETQENAWKSMIQNGWGQYLENFKLGRLTQNVGLLNTISVRKMMSSQQGNYVGLEQSFSGSLYGEQISGVIQGIAFSGNTGTLLLATVIKGKGSMLSNSIQVKTSIQNSVQENPQFLRALQKPKQNGHLASGQGSWRVKNSRLENDMNGEYVNPYNGNDNVTDWIYGTKSIDNPVTGLRERVDGNYQYHFVDPYGTYQGSNDPNYGAQTGYQQIGEAGGGYQSMFDSTPDPNYEYNF